MPLTEITNATYMATPQRPVVQEHHLRRRARCCFDVDAAVFESLFAEQARGKGACLDSNVKALHLG